MTPSPRYRGGNPLISVLIPAFNSARHIEEAIVSVLRQDYRPVEVVVMDDGSTDNTAAIVQQFPVELVRYYYQENRGVAAARNACLTHARGNFIAQLDSDDYYLAGKLCAQMDYLHTHPEAELVFTGYMNFAANDPDRKELPEAEHIHLYGCCKGNLYHATLLVRRELLEKTGAFCESLVVGEDAEWLYRLQYQYAIDLIHIIDKTYYMRRSSNTSLFATKHALGIEARKIMTKYLKNNIRKKLSDSI